MNRLTNLMALTNRARALTRTVTPAVTASDGRTWFRIANAAPADESTDVFIYDEIGYWGITAADFISALSQVNTKAMNLHINSPGGDVFDGIAIHAALVNHKATVTTVVDGLAASAASFIAQAGATRAIEKPGTMLIHDAWGGVIGNAVDMRNMADLLDEISSNIAGIYADRAGAKPADFRTAMQANNGFGTTYTSAAAVAAGLADEVRNDNAAPEDRRSQLIRARARVTLKG